jgi:hypothetical protein
MTLPSTNTDYKWYVVESRSDKHPEYGFPMGKVLCKSLEEAKEYIEKSEYKDCFISKYKKGDK